MRFPLKAKITVLIVTVIVSIGAITTVTCCSILSNVITKQYSLYSINLANTVAVTVDSRLARSVRDEIMEIYRKTENRVSSEEWGTPEFDAYTALYADIEKSGDFIALRDQLRKIQDVNNVDCIFLAYLDQASESTVYIVDAAYENTCPPGCFDPFLEEDYALVKQPEKGFSTSVTDTEAYGWIVTTEMPVYDDGEIIAYAGVDISMNDIAAQQWNLILIVFGVILFLIVVFSLIGVLAVNHFLIKPIKMLTETSEQYYSPDSAVVRRRFSELRIRTGDEIETLAEAMAKMENDIDVHIDNLLATTKALDSANIRADRLNMIASLDALTNVQNKRAYYQKTDQLNEAIKNGTAAFGIVMIDLNDLKMINDTFGHEKGDVSIKTLCKILNSVFVHSSVFRIGGDEFVIIPEGEDHEHAKELLRSLKEKLTALNSNEEAEPWERISAAIGYADFDPDSDPDVDSVFQRADRMMYENKQFIKNSY